MTVMQSKDENGLLQFGEAILEKKVANGQICWAELEQFLLIMRSNKSRLKNVVRWENLLQKMQQEYCMVSSEYNETFGAELLSLICEQAFLSGIGSITNWKWLTKASQSSVCARKLMQLLEFDIIEGVQPSNIKLLQTEWTELLANLPPLNPVKFVLKMPNSFVLVQIMQHLVNNFSDIFMQIHAPTNQFPLYITVEFICRVLLTVLKSSSSNLHFVFQFDAISSRMLVKCFICHQKMPIPIVVAEELAKQKFQLDNIALFFPNSYRVSQQVLKCCEKRLLNGIGNIKLDRTKTKLSNGIELLSICKIYRKKSKIFVSLTNGKTVEISKEPNELLFDCLRVVSGLVTEISELYSIEQILKVILFDLYYSDIRDQI